MHRPRNVDWKRAAALLYGDWGTSKAYVIGLAFIAAGFASLPIILAVCILTAIVAYNYIIVCAHFPEGGGVYSAARQQSRFLASVGALLLIANFIVTAALSGWAGASYLGVPTQYAPLAAMGIILFVGVINYFGPKHSGSVSIYLAVPAILVVIAIIIFSIPHLNTAHLEPRHEDLGNTWVAFVGVILALSGVEAIANITGVMKLDPGLDTSRSESHENGGHGYFAGGSGSSCRNRAYRVGDAFARQIVRTGDRRPQGGHVAFCGRTLRDSAWLAPGLDTPFPGLSELFSDSCSSARSTPRSWR